MKPYKYHVVYVIGIPEVRRFYIGCHSTDFVNDSYFGSGTRIRKLVSMLGIRASSWESTLKKRIVGVYSCRDAALAAEKALIDKHIGSIHCLNERRVKRNVSSYVAVRAGRKVEADNMTQLSMATGLSFRQINESIRGISARTNGWSITFVNKI